MGSNVCISHSTFTPLTADGGVNDVSGKVSQRETSAQKEKAHIYQAHQQMTKEMADMLGTAEDKMLRSHIQQMEDKRDVKNRQLVLIFLTLIFIAIVAYLAMITHHEHLV